MSNTHCTLFSSHSSTEPRLAGYTIDVLPQCVPKTTSGVNQSRLVHDFHDMQHHDVSIPKTKTSTLTRKLANVQCCCLYLSPRKRGIMFLPAYVCLFVCLPVCLSVTMITKYKKLSYRRGSTRCIVSIEILPIATQQCRNYLYDKP